jgi:epoxyqueuosine reductase
MFGCDTCQEVCPWNRFSRPHTEPAFEASPMIIDFKTQEWLDFQQDVFKQQFKDSPLARAKWTGIQRNLRFLLGQ